MNGVRELDVEPATLATVSQSRLRGLFAALLAPSGVTIDGDQPWDIRVHDERLFRRVATSGSLGFGEAYLDGWWDCERLDEFFARVLAAEVSERLWWNPASTTLRLAAWLVNRQSKARAFVVGRRHYDLGNDVFEATFDRRVTGSCAYWKNASTIDEAQEAKLDLVCRKIGLKGGDTVLDIGCGWGAFMKFAAERYGARSVGITVSREQIKLASELCAGLPVEFRFMDYRDVTGKFDHVVSMEMFEQVGHKNLRRFFEIAHRSLKNGGLFLLHTIGTNESSTVIDPWLDKYIFPNGALPSIQQIGRAIEGLFVMEDWHNFGADYDRTILAWFANFERSWPRLAAKYGDRFYRMWKYYWLSCAGGFRSRTIQLWQIVLSKRGIAGGYASVR